MTFTNKYVKLNAKLFTHSQLNKEKMKKVLSAYWRYSKGIRKFGLAAIVVMMISFFLRNILRPLALKGVFDGLNSGPDQILWLVFLFALVALIGNVFYSLGDFLISAYEGRQIRTLRNVAFREMIKHPLSFFAHTFSGSLVTKQRRFVGSAEVLFDELSGQYLYILIQVVGVVVVMSTVSTPMMVGFLVWIILYCIVAILAASKRMKLDTFEAEMDSKVTGSFADPIGNIALVKLFGTHEREQNRFRKVTEKHYEALMASWTFSNWQSVIQRIFSSSLHIGALAGSVYLWQTHQLSVGGIVLVTTYASQLVDCLWDFSRSIKRSTKAIADAKEMTEIINLPAAISDRPNASPNPELEPHQRSIEFNQVTFAYPSGTHVFDNFSLSIESGKKVAIIGTTGAGKTSLVQLLLRSVEAQSGSIRVGPYDISKDVTQDGLKLLVSCVPQNTDMFHRSIFDNIAYGKQDATEAEVHEFAKKARIHDFIMSLPKGYHTKVGERGVMLSGGQKQRIAIARALLHDAPILILDEATSSLDNVTEKEIQCIFEESLADKTVIVIAHRLSTIRNCDRIIVLEEGKIVQDGSHDELVRDESGIYYQMLNSHDLAVREEVFA